MNDYDDLASLYNQLEEALSCIELAINELVDESTTEIREDLISVRDKTKEKMQEIEPELEKDAMQEKIELERIYRSQQGF